MGFTIKRQNVLNINFHYYKNRICSLIKNLGGTGIVTVLPVHLAISGGIALAFLIRGNVNSSFMIIRAISWNLLNIRKTLEKRTKIQNSRVLSDEELFHNLSVPVNWSKFFGDFKRVEEDIKKKN